MFITLLLKSFRLKALLFIFIFCFPSLAHTSSIDVILYGGMKRFNGTKISEPSLGPYKASFENHAWIFGMDTVYKFPIHLNIGIRYQHLISSGMYKHTIEESQTQEDIEKLQPFYFNFDRISFLTSYQFISRPAPVGFFLGLLLAIDLWHYMRFDMPETNDLPFDKKLTHQQWGWEKITGQAGLELGLRWTQLFIKTEVGYILSSFDDLICESTTKQCDDHTSEDIFSLSSFYGIIGIGYSF